MSEIIFVNARSTSGILFESYADYHNMIRMWEYKTCELQEIDYQSDNVYIWSSPIGNPHQVFLNDAARARKCKLVLWWLEWPKWENGVLTGWDGVEDAVDEVWVSDKHLLTLAQNSKANGAQKFRFVFFGGHPDFGDADYDGREFLWDAVHISYLTGVRGAKFSILQQAMTMAPNGWGAERHHSLMHSRWGLNIHQNPLASLAPQRFMIFASYKLPIITDVCENPWPYMVFQDALIHFDPRQTSVMNREWAKRQTDWNYKLVTVQNRFKKCVDDAVADLRFRDKERAMQ